MLLDDTEAAHSAPIFTEALTEKNINIADGEEHGVRTAEIGFWSSVNSSETNLLRLDSHSQPLKLDLSYDRTELYDLSNRKLTHLMQAWVTDTPFVQFIYNFALHSMCLHSLSHCIDLYIDTSVCVQCVC